MEKMRLGRTNMNVCRTGMGCLPLQRISQKEAVSLIRRAFDNGIDFLIRPEITRIVNPKWERL